MSQAIPDYLIFGDPEEFKTELRAQEVRENPPVANLEDEGPLVPDEILNLCDERPEYRNDILRAYQTLAAEKEFMEKVVAGLEMRRLDPQAADPAATAAWGRPPAAVAGSGASLPYGSALASVDMGRRDSTQGGLSAAESPSNYSPRKSMTRRKYPGTMIPDPEGDKMRAAQKVLEKFQKQEQLWTAMNDRLSSLTGREVADTVFNRTYELRRRKEFAELLESAIPLEEKYVDSQWLMSLRDNWTRYTPLGNIFSGLFISAEEYVAKDRPIEVIGRPAGLMDARLAASMARSSIRARARHRGWEDSEYLKTRKAQYEGRMNKLLPHHPELDGLFVQGSSLEETFYRRASHDVTAEDVEKYLFSSDPQRFASFGLSKRPDTVPEGDENEPHAARSTRKLIVEPVGGFGPHASLSDSHLALTCMTGGVAQGSLVLTNLGSTALYLDWRRAAQPGPLSEGEVSAPLHDASPAGAFIISPMTVSVLPAATQEFRITFSALAPGTVLEHWTLETRPKLTNKLPRIVLRGLSVVEDANQLSRRGVTAKLEEREKQRVVQRAIERVLEDFACTTDPAPVLKDLPGYDIDESLRFAAAHAESDPDLYYSPAVQGQAKAAYGECRRFLHEIHAARAKKREEEEAAAAEAAKATKGKKKVVDEDSAPPPLESEPSEAWPADWDGSIPSLAAIAAALSDYSAAHPEGETAVAAAGVASQTVSDAAKWRDLLRIPPSHDSIVARAIRDYLLRLSDEVEARGDQIMTSLGPASFMVDEAELEGLTEEEVEERQKEEEARAVKAQMAKWRTKALAAVKKIVAAGVVGPLWEHVSALEQALLEEIDRRIASLGASDKSAPEGLEKQWQHAQWVRIKRQLVPAEVIEAADRVRYPPPPPLPGMLEEKEASKAPSVDPSHRRVPSTVTAGQPAGGPALGAPSVGAAAGRRISSSSTGTGVIPPAPVGPSGASSATAGSSLGTVVSGESLSMASVGREPSVPVVGGGLGSASMASAKRASGGSGRS